MSRWNEWIDIEKNASYKGCRVYKIPLADSKGYPIEIPRFLDKDKDGILQIGGSEDTERPSPNSMFAVRFVHLNALSTSQTHRTLGTMNNLYNLCSFIPRKNCT
ncbi:MAG: hypothetical protein ACE5KT_11070 [Methanosarcinales archaeon]